ncbi:MAG TPA: hypothetical protein ENK19_10230, partial [Acidobacteria bacterium]|nr:hypothetical protein [Acidobacteriota bacterium]
MSRISLRKVLILASILFLGTALAAQAVPTTITVRVMALNGKFLGTTMGGARIVLRDADTGRILASGLTSGSTGDTEHIMETPHERRFTYSTEGSASFTAVIDIDRPTRVEVTATGPMANRGAANTVSSTQWVLPGKDITGGDGWLLELRGFSVQVMAPATHIKLHLLPMNHNTVTVHVEANITLMCGCPLGPGTLWDSDGYEIVATVTRDGKPFGRYPMTYARAL